MAWNIGAAQNVGWDIGVSQDVEPVFSLSIGAVADEFESSLSATNTPPVFSLSIGAVADEFESSLSATNTPPVFNLSIGAVADEFEASLLAGNTPLDTSDLIDKQDNSEIIRDQIAYILVNEVIRQKEIAVLIGRDPQDWNLKIYLERSNPWEQYQTKNSNKTPIVNIWIDNSNIDLSSSDLIERQKTKTTYNIDVYGCGVSESNGSGHTPGDRTAAFECQRAVRLVRNMLMKSKYLYLDLPRGTAWDRHFTNINFFQPQISPQSIQNVVGCRMSFSVSHNEFSPQYSGDNLNYISIDIKRAEDGEILVEADYDYTT